MDKSKVSQPFTCKRCGKGFNQKWNLTHHRCRAGVPSLVGAATPKAERVFPECPSKELREMLRELSINEFPDTTESKTLERRWYRRVFLDDTLDDPGKNPDELSTGASDFQQPSTSRTKYWHPQVLPRKIKSEKHKNPHNYPEVPRDRSEFPQGAGACFRLRPFSNLSLDNTGDCGVSSQYPSEGSGRKQRFRRPDTLKGPGKNPDELTRGASDFQQPSTSRTKYWHPQLLTDKINSEKRENPHNNPEVPRDRSEFPQGAGACFRLRPFSSLSEEKPVSSQYPSKHGGRKEILSGQDKTPAGLGRNGSRRGILCSRDGGRRLPYGDVGGPAPGPRFPLAFVERPVPREPVAERKFQYGEAGGMQRRQAYDGRQIAPQRIEGESEFLREAVGDVGEPSQLYEPVCEQCDELKRNHMNEDGDKRRRGRGQGRGRGRARGRGEIRGRGHGYRRVGM